MNKEFYFDVFADGFRKPMLTTYSKALVLAKRYAKHHTNTRLDVWDAKQNKYVTLWSQV